MDYICNECHGNKEVAFISEVKTDKILAMITCPKCGGVGWLDWVEVVTGKHGVKQEVCWLSETERRKIFQQGSRREEVKLADNRPVVCK